MNELNWNTVFCASGSALLCGIVAFKIFSDKCKNLRKSCATEVNEVLVHGAENEERMKELEESNIFCIYYLIIHANRSIDICVPSIICETLANCLISVSTKVTIRVAIHNSDNFHKLQALADHGIEVKVINTAERMEHEFILIDAASDFKNAVVVIGSLNYKTNRNNCNRDTTMLTSDNKVARALKKEFDRIWNFLSNL